MSSRSARLRSAPTSMPSELNALVEAIAARRLILFIGGGVSQNLGLPDFGTLVRHLENELGFPPNLKQPLSTQSSLKRIS